MIRKLCLWLSKHLNHTTIWVPDPVTGIKAPYLTRYYLFGADRKWGNIYLHHFHDSDKGPELHNHPWKWSFGIILTGGYSEERRTADDNVEPRLVKPGTINYITNKIFHRVDLLEKMHGPYSLRVQELRIGVSGIETRNNIEIGALTLTQSNKARHVRKEN